MNYVNIPASTMIAALTSAITTQDYVEKVTLDYTQDSVYLAQLREARGIIVNGGQIKVRHSGS